MIIILFGLAGSGKTYVGNLFKTKFGFCHLDADEWLTDEMKECIMNNKSFTQEMLDNFTEILIEKIEHYRQKHQKLAFSQGLYRASNRNQILKHFASLNTKLYFIEIISAAYIERIINRNDNITEQYALSIAKNYEPMPGALQILNNHHGDSELVKQINKILKIINL